jgi:hypothetical protein
MSNLNSLEIPSSPRKRTTVSSERLKPPTASSKTRAPLGLGRAVVIVGSMFHPAGQRIKVLAGSSICARTWARVAACHRALAADGALDPIEEDPFDRPARVPSRSRSLTPHRSLGLVTLRPGVVAGRCFV